MRLPSFKRLAEPAHASRREWMGLARSGAGMVGADPGYLLAAWLPRTS